MRFPVATRSLLAGLVAVALISLPAQAAAQAARGGLGGRVVDSTGKPVEGAVVVLENPDVALKYTIKTNARGEWAQGGMPVGNRMNITVTKGDMVGGIKGVPVRQGSITEMPDPIVISAAAPKVSPEEVKRAAEAKAREAAVAKIKAEVTAAIAANDFDTAIAKYNEATTTIPNCAQCFVTIGDLQMRKKALPEAEKAYLQALSIDPGLVEAYSALAAIYNQQKNYAKAGEMTAKITSLSASSGGDAPSEFSAGAIAVNMMVAAEREGKADEAKAKMTEAMARFQKAIQLKPDMAEAYWELGMLYVKQNNVPEAKKALAKYLEIAPTGPNAETAKAIASMP